MSNDHTPPANDGDPSRRPAPSPVHAERTARRPYEPPAYPRSDRAVSQADGSA
jgi:hypothetical protein